MSAQVVHGHQTTHVTLRVGVLVAQFYINRDGLVPPMYVYDRNGYSEAYPVHTLDALPASLQPEVTRLVRQYQTHHILKGDT